MTHHSELRELLGKSPTVRIPHVGEIEPTTAWYGVTEPFGRQFPYIGMSLDRHLYGELPSMSAVRDVIVDGENAEVVFMDVFSHSEEHVAEYRYVSFAADCVIEMGDEEDTVVV